MDRSPEDGPTPPAGARAALGRLGLSGEELEEALAALARAPMRRAGEINPYPHGSNEFVVLRGYARDALTAEPTLPLDALQRAVMQRWDTERPEFAEALYGCAAPQRAEFYTDLISVLTAAYRPQH